MNSRDLDGLFESFFSSANSNAVGWGPVQEFPPYTEILKQDTPAIAVYHVESGLLKLSRMDRLGHEIIAGLRRRHWILGAPAVLRGKQYSFTITTLTSCSLRSISAKKFIDLVDTDTHFSRQMLAMLSQEIFTYGRSFFNLGCLPAIDRLKRLLYEIVTDLEQPSDLKHRVKLQVPLKQKEMAQMIAVTPEHLCRLLKKMEQENIIRRDKGWLIVKDTQSLMHECEI